MRNPDRQIQPAILPSKGLRVRIVAAHRSFRKLKGGRNEPVYPLGKRYVENRVGGEPPILQRLAERADGIRETATARTSNYEKESLLLW